MIMMVVVMMMKMMLNIPMAVEWRSESKTKTKYHATKILQTGTVNAIMSTI
jgi:hypothetical protein